MTAMLMNNLTDSLNVTCSLNEGSRNEVHIIFNTENKVLLILLRNRWQTKRNTRNSYTLTVTHLTIIKNLSNNILALNFLNSKTNKTIG